MLTFPENAYALVAITALMGSAGSLPLWRAWCLRIGHVDNPGHRKIHSHPVPLAGGFAVFTGISLTLFCGLIFLVLGGFDTDAQDKLRYGLSRRAFPLAAIWFGAAAMVLLGWWDDRKALSPAIKFAGQFAVCLLVAAAGIRATVFVPSTLFSYAITILWILTITNAINFNDNMNGLCAGLALVASLFFGWIAARNGQYLVALLAFTTVGSVAGFLPYNFPKGRAFLGDAGSHLIGYLLAILAILPHFYSPKHDANRPLAVFSPLLILAVPLLDLLWVTWNRTRRGQPFWVADTQHLSHRLVRLGLTKVQAVLVLWVLALAFAATTLLTVR